MLLTPIAPSTLLTAHPTCTACPLTSLTQHHLAYLTCTSCFTSASLTLFVPPNHPTHTVNPTHPTYTTYTAHSYYCANCPFLPVHAPIYSSHLRSSESAVSKENRVSGGGLLFQRGE